MWVSRQSFSFEVFFPESNVVVRQPVILKGFDIFECEANIVIAEVGSVGVQRVAKVAGHALTERHPGAFGLWVFEIVDVGSS